MHVVLVMEFGDGKISFVEGTATKKSLKVISHGYVELQPNILDDGAIKDFHALKELLEGALSEHGVKSRKAVFLINSNAVLIRKIELPHVKSAKETEKMLNFKLQELLPSFFYRYKCMYKTVGWYNSNGIKKATHVVYGINRKTYDHYKNLADSLKMDLKSLDVSSNCISRIDEKEDMTGSVREKYAVAFICLEENGASLCISTNGTAVFHKNFKSFSSSEECVNEVLKCFRFYKSSNKDIPIAATYMYGEAADEKTREKFRYELETSSEKIKDLPAISGIEKIQETDIYKFISLLVSLKTYKKDKNFLSDEKNLHKLRFNAALAVMSLCVIVIAVIAYFSVDRVLRNEIKNSQLNAMNMFITDEDNIAINSRIIGIRSRIDYLEKYYKEALKIKDEFGEDRLICSDLFEKIRSCAPEGTKIKSISSDCFTSVVSCSSDSLKEVTLFAANLRNVDFIEDINIANIEISRDMYKPGCDYQVTCILKGVENEEQ